MRKIEILAIVLTLASVVAAYLIFPYMPEQMASHWNAAGEVDDTMPRFWGLALMPIVFAMFTLMLIFIPQIDPLKKNVKKFLGYFDGFIFLLFLFFLLIFGQMILWNLGTEISFTATMPAAMAVLLFYIGMLLEKSKRNWFIGIRTPWTLSSDKVWDKTHKLGAKLFKAIAIVTLLGMFLPEYVIWIMLVPLLVATVYIIAYSYFEYRKEN